tara:strand:- start:320 stop:1156 length:837 start_codon:yes stop_codon:yes gene_type:complete
MNNVVSIRWVVALRAEAKEIIDKYKLYSFDHKGPFPIYRSKNQDIWLTISGVGQVNSAAASMYLYQISTKLQSSVWINIGIAGFEKNYGEIFRIDKIISNNNKKTFYPSRVTKNNFSNATLMTVDKPGINYSDKYMIDMEGAAFFQTISKVSSNELILIIKIVSDNSRNKLESINTANIHNLFKENFDYIEDCLSEYIKLSKEEHSRKKLPNKFDEIISMFNFTVSQKYILIDLSKKWTAIFPNKNLIDIARGCKDGRSVIRKLKTALDENIIDWGQY